MRRRRPLPAHAGRLGLGRFHIAETDPFELVNFNRQVGATMATIGRPKIEVRGVRVDGALGMGIAISSNLESGGFALGGLIATGGLVSLVVGTGLEIAAVRDAARAVGARVTLAPLRAPTGSAPGLVVHATL